MRSIVTVCLLALILSTFTGCTSETRTSWENSPQFRHTKGIEVPPHLAPEGIVRVIYPDNKPSMSFGTLGHPETNSYSFEHGIHINDYDANGVLVSHKWQASVPLKD